MLHLFYLCVAAQIIHLEMNDMSGATHRRQIPTSTLCEASLAPFINSACFSTPYPANKRTCCPEIWCQMFDNPSSFPHSGVCCWAHTNRNLEEQPSVCAASPLHTDECRLDISLQLAFKSLCCCCPPTPTSPTPPLPQNRHQIGRSYILMRPIIAL